LLLAGKGHTRVLLNGVYESDEVTHMQTKFQHEGIYQGICTKCKNTLCLITDELKLHFICKGFVRWY